MKNNWQVKRLDQVSTVTMGQSPPSSSYNTEGVGVPFLQGTPPVVDNLGTAVPNQWTTEPTKVVEAGTALMTVRAPVGELYTTNNSVCLGRGLAGIKANNNVSQEYLNNYLQFAKNQFNSVSQGSTFTAINSNDLKGIEVVLPSYKQQEYFGKVLSVINQQIAKTDQVIQKTEILKKGLMQQLLAKGIGHKKFKKTKLGEIPEDWELIPIGEICDCIVPGRNKPKKFDGDIPWITIPNIDDSTIQYNNSTKYVSRQELKNCGNKIIPINSVIMSCVGDFGIVAVADREIAINQQLHAFLPSSKLNQTFLKFALILQKRFMENLATKTSIPYLNKTSCNSIPIVKPPIEEQLRISEILSSLEEKITKDKFSKEKLVTLKNGLMQDIFSQKIQIN